MLRSMRSRQKIFGHHELTNLGLQPSDFDSPLGQETARDVDTLTRWCPGIHSMIFELEEL